jgi:4-diphosphocytidyl-2-C-methyl-D-erythritol kinase
VSRQSGRAWPAPAKLNLFLRITGRRADGYHELQTCFQFLDWCDELDFRVTHDGRIERVAGAAGVAPENDLCIRAARLLQAVAGAAQGVEIALTKRLPMGAGLGGGSSDAATTLVALNALWELGLSVDRLAELGLGLGADVPVFVRGRAAFGEGVGERLTPLVGANAPIELNYLIIKPNASISTAAVFQDPELTRNSAPITIEGLLTDGVRNDCESVVRRRYPSVGAALDWLGQFGASRLTGTGACVFLGLDSFERCCELRALVPPEFDAWVARGLNDSPLLSRAGLARASSMDC